MGQETLTTYCGFEPVVDARYHPESDRPPMDAIIDALAEAAEVDPLELPPLYDFVDGDAIDSLFQKRDGNDADAVLCFRMEDWDVFVRNDGRIRVCDNTRSSDPKPVFEPSLA